MRLRDVRVMKRVPVTIIETGIVGRTQAWRNRAKVIGSMAGHHAFQHGDIGFRIG
jgi:hypothetical protein